MRLRVRVRVRLTVHGSAGIAAMFSLMSAQHESSTLASPNVELVGVRLGRRVRVRTRVRDRVRVRVRVIGLGHTPNPNPHQVVRPRSQLSICRAGTPRPG